MEREPRSVLPGCCHCPVTHEINGLRENPAVTACRRPAWSRFSARSGHRDSAERLFLGILPRRRYSSSVTVFGLSEAVGDSGIGAPEGRTTRCLHPMQAAIPLSKGHGRKEREGGRASGLAPGFSNFPAPVWAAAPVVPVVLGSVDWSSKLQVEFRGLLTLLQQGVFLG